MRLINFNSNIIINLQEPRWNSSAISMTRKVLNACRLQKYGVSIILSNDKYVQLPWGIRELKSFFSDGVKTESGDYDSNTIVKKLLTKIIHSEDPSKPFNDKEITKLVNKEGYIIARRTITKYRELLKIPVSRLRKKNI